MKNIAKKVDDLATPIPITKMRQLSDRFRIVFKQCSLFGTLNHVNKHDDNHNNCHKLEKFAINLGFSCLDSNDDIGTRLHVPQRYPIMLRVFYNYSRKYQCCYCRQLKRKLKKCKNCKTKFFCSRICQKNDWKLDRAHAARCSTKCRLN